jgi:hypothetical protein
MACNDKTAIENLGLLGDFLTQVSETARRLRQVPGGPSTITFNFYLRDIITMTDNSNASTITVGASNQGSVTVVQDSDNVRITNNIGALKERAETKSIATAFEDIQKAVTTSTDLDEKTKTDLLHAVSALSEQAKKDEGDRTSWSISGALGFIKATVTAVGTLSTLWDKWGDTISSFFSSSSTG